MSSLQIYQWVCQWKNFENRLTFGEVMGKSSVSCFFWDTVYIVKVTEIAIISVTIKLSNIHLSLVTIQLLFSQLINASQSNQTDSLFIIQSTLNPFTHTSSVIQVITSSQSTLYSMSLSSSKLTRLTIPDITLRHIGLSDVIESTVTIRSPFCAYNMA